MVHVNGEIESVDYIQLLMAQTAQLNTRVNDLEQRRAALEAARAE